MARRRAKRVDGKTWAIRAGIGIGAGILLGFIIGAVTVKVIEPPVVASSESDVTSPRKPRTDAEPANGDEPPSDTVKQADGVLVPKLIGMEEGDARDAILRAGFAIGSVTFKASSAPMGTVLESIPIPGEAIVLPATVSIILSDGKGRIDSLPAAPLR